VPVHNSVAIPVGGIASLSACPPLLGQDHEVTEIDNRLVIAMQIELSGFICPGLHNDPEKTKYPVQAQQEDTALRNHRLCSSLFLMVDGEASFNIAGPTDPVIEKGVCVACLGSPPKCYYFQSHGGLAANGIFITPEPVCGTGGGSGTSSARRDPCTGAVEESNMSHKGEIGGEAAE